MDEVSSLWKGAETSVTDLNHNSDYAAILYVNVGKHAFSVHEDLACKTSIFFQRKVNVSQVRSTRKRPWMHVRLSGFAPDLVRAWIHWTDHGEFVIDVRWPSETLQERREQRTCIEALILVEHLGDAKFRQVAIAALTAKISVWKVFLSASLITQVWEATPTQSYLRAVVLYWLFSGRPTTGLSRSSTKRPSLRGFSTRWPWRRCAKTHPGALRRSTVSYVRRACCGPDERMSVRGSVGGWRR